MNAISFSPYITRALYNASCEENQHRQRRAAADSAGGNSRACASAHEEREETIRRSRPREKKE